MPHCAPLSPTDFIILILFLRTLHIRWDCGSPMCPIETFMIILYFTLCYFSYFSDPHNLLSEKAFFFCFFSNYPEKFPIRSSLLFSRNRPRWQPYSVGNSQLFNQSKILYQIYSKILDQNFLKFLV